MSLKDYSKEELKIKPMVEIAGFILQDAKKALSFQEIYDQVAEIKGLTKKAKEEKIAQFYTELNVDGRFMTLGSNVWGMKVWYPVDQADEEITAPPKKKTKAKKKVVEDDEEEFELEEDLEVKELGEEDIVLEDEDEDDDEDEEDTGFIELDEELDVEDEDLKEEISDEDDEIDEDEEE